MAFNLNLFQIACASVDGAAGLSTYRTDEDNASAIKVAGYFDKAPLRHGDIIFIRAADYTFIAQCTNDVVEGRTIGAIRKFDGTAVL